jgi:hypothetical protein
MLGATWVLPKHGVLKQKPTGHEPLPAQRRDVCKANSIKLRRYTSG